MTVDWIAAAIAYLLGSIPFGYLLVLLFRKEDIRQSGSGNIGATNVMRSGSRWLGIFTLLLDLGKGFAAVEIARHLTTGAHATDTASIGALFAVIGHVFPIWLRGKGGKGVATALGVFLALAPLAALSSLGVFIVVTFLTRYVSLASILAAASFPVWVWLAARLFAIHYGQGPIFIASTVLVPAVILIKHREERRAAAAWHGIPLWQQRKQRRMSRIAVVGAGSWGTALAMVLARRGGHSITMWSHTRLVADCIQQTRENCFYLPGLRIPEAVQVTTELEDAVGGGKF